MSDRSRTTQRAGDNSNQIHADGDVIIGVTEERVREIAEQTAQIAIGEYTDDAHHVIQERILKLDDRVIAQLVRDGRLHVFADPGFQRTYIKAQAGAASTEREEDYDLLAALISDRAERGEHRPIRAGIDKAIECIDQIDSSSLRGLTVHQAVMQYTYAHSRSLDSAISVLSELLGQLVDGPLPTGEEWIDHLDILDAVRIGHGQSFRKFDDFHISHHFFGYMSEGVPASTTLLPFTVNGRQFNWDGAVGEHELKPGYIRLLAGSKSVLSSFASPSGINEEELLAKADSDLHFSTVDEDVKTEVITRVRADPTLGQIADWIDSHKVYFSPTGIGRVIARANAERLDEKSLLPKLL